MHVADQGRLVTARTGLPAVGPLSELIASLLSAPPLGGFGPAEAEAAIWPLIDAVEDPCGDDDLQLALYLCYELHYRSFPKVSPAWEWNPTLLAVRALLEATFFGSLDAEVPSHGVAPAEVGDLLFRLEAEDPALSLSRQLEIKPDLERFRELVVHHSFHQLKEADPHSWAVPRLDGAAKTALLELLGDEYGDGRPERMRSTLFARTMRALDLDDRENAYLEHAPGISLAAVNLISGFGLHRSRRGAAIGHLAMFEMTSAQINRRYGDVLRRFGLNSGATDFYDEHSAADAVHENIAAYDLAGGLARQEPELAADILFGARALLALEAAASSHMLDAWQRGDTSLRRPLRAAVTAG